MTVVIKKGGKKQAFRAAKILKAVNSACKDAKIPAAKRKKIVTEVVMPLIIALKEKSKVKTSDISKVLVARMGKISKRAAASWKKYNKAKSKKK